MKLKYKIQLIIYLLSTTISRGQFGTSLPCQINTNANPINNGRFSAKRATFKIEFVKNAGLIGSCTGTMINRQTNQNDLGFYFVTARHCIEDDNGNIDINLSGNHNLIFNFESADGQNNSVPLSNRGDRRSQSTSLASDGYHYFHSSRLRLVADYSWGDFALFEVLTPIPPHFNIAYSGWNTSPVQFATVPFPNFYAVVHHPSGDIKKISTTNNVLGGNPVNQACRVVTKVIDFLFCWIWGCNTSTEVVCSYTENPHASVISWNMGNTEPGSSGSSLLNDNNNILGVLTGNATPINTECGALRGLKRFGKFRVSYFRQSTKNALNPDNKYWTDQLGLDGRIITCYQNLNNLSGEYFAASAYQANNRITLQSATTVTTNGTLRVHPGADYSLVASQSITLGPGFEVVRPQAGETGGIFETRIATCAVPRSDDNSNDIPSDVIRKARNLELPQYKPFNPQQFLNKNNSLVDLDAQSDIQAYPNPSSDGNFTVRFVVDAKKSVNLAFTDILGKTIYTTKYSCIQGENYFPLDMSGKGISAGMYFIIVDEGINKKVKKVIIK